MKRYWILLAALILAVPRPNSATPNPARTAKLAEAYGKLPLPFERNQGQTDSTVQYLSRGSGYTLFLTQDHAVLELHQQSSAPSRDPKQAFSKLKPLSPPAPPEVLDLHLLGANLHAAITGADELPGRANYFLGNDPKKWQSDVPTYSKVKYAGVYPGIDLVYYGHQGSLEYDYILCPGTDPSAIRFTLDDLLSKKSPHGRRTRRHHATAVRIAPNGDLVVQTGTKEIRFARPVAYQPDSLATVRQPRDPQSGKALIASYVLSKKDEIGFSIPNHDRSKPLVIDPVLSYSTYFGGDGYEAGTAIKVDAAGNMYVAGDTYSLNFPSTSGAFQPSCAPCTVGGSDAFVSKLNSTGTALIFSTYLGNADAKQYQSFASGLAIDSAGNAYVVGYTNSSDFPTTAGAFQTTCPAACNFLASFVSKLDATGSALAYSTYLSGSGSGISYKVAVDAAQNAYVTGTTCASDFPVTSGAFQTTYGGGDCVGFLEGDGFVAKLNASGSALVFSTFLGGSSYDQTLGIAIDSVGNVFVSGETQSPNFPVVSGSFQTTCAGGCSNFDAFVTKLNPNGSALVYSTFLGGTGIDEALGLAIDSAGNAFVTGGTGSADFPTTPGAFQTQCGGGCAQYPEDAFVTKLNAAGSSLVYSTFVGGSVYDFAEDIAVDGSGDAYVTGSSNSNDYPFTPGAYQGSCDQCSLDAYDAIVTVVNPSGSQLMYSSYLGGGENDSGTSIALDSLDSFYLTGNTNSSDFPITSSAVQPALGGNYDAFIAKFSFTTEVLPTAIKFGNQLLNATSAPMTATLINGSTVALNISSIAINGANSPDFAQTSTCGTTLPAGQSCTLNVTFTPSILGAEAATLTIIDDAKNSPQTIALSGVGSQPGAVVNPTALVFPEQFIGGRTLPQSVTLTNTGGVALSVSSIATTANFAQTNNCTTSLAAGATCTVRLLFAPTQRGPLTGSLTLTDNAPGGPQVVALSGTGTFLRVAPTTFNFGNEKVGRTSQPQTISLTNVGHQTLTLADVIISGVNATDFADQDTCDSTLGPGATCYIVVIFTPTATGQRQAKLLIQDNAGGSPQKTILRGIGN